VNAELPVKRAAHFHRVKEGPTANLLERNQPLALKLAEVSQTWPCRFVGEDDAEAGFRANEAGGRV
jgi:hypothetical protein